MQECLYEALAPPGQPVLQAIGEQHGLGFLMADGTLTVAQASVISGTDSDPRFEQYYAEPCEKPPSSSTMTPRSATWLRSTPMRAFYHHRTHCRAARHRHLQMPISCTRYILIYKFSRAGGYTLPRLGNTRYISSKSARRRPYGPDQSPSGTKPNKSMCRRASVKRCWKPHDAGHPAEIVAFAALAGTPGVRRLSSAHTATKRAAECGIRRPAAERHPRCCFADRHHPVRRLRRGSLSLRRL